MFERTRGVFGLAGFSLLDGDRAYVVVPTGDPEDGEHHCPAVSRSGPSRAGACAEWQAPAMTGDALELRRGSAADLPALEPLWVAVHHHHAESMPELARASTVPSGSTSGAGIDPPTYHGSRAARAREALLTSVYRAGGGVLLPFATGTAPAAMGSPASMR